MTTQRLWAGMALVSVFACGALAGAVYERHHAMPPAQQMSAEEVHAAAMAELTEVVGLDEQQVEQIQAVLHERQALVQQAWEQVRPQVQHAMEQVHVEIAELLRPDQRRAYHEWLSRQREESRNERFLIIPH